MNCVDFTAHPVPSMAVACPKCGARAGRYCRRPSGHAGPMVGIHRERHAEADRVHEAQGGGWIVRTPDGRWEAYPLDGLPPHIAAEIGAGEEPRKRAVASRRGSVRTAAPEPPRPVQPRLI